MQIKKFTVDRRTWLRGEGGVSSKLMRSSDGKMCCLGFLGEACGLTKTALRDNGDFTDLSRPLIAEIPQELVKRGDHVGLYSNTEIATQLMNLNDETGIDDIERERSLTCIFAQIGLTVEFQN